MVDAGVQKLIWVSAPPFYPAAGTSVRQVHHKPNPAQAGMVFCYGGCLAVHDRILDQLVQFEGLLYE